MEHIVGILLYYILYNYLTRRLSLRNASLPATLSKQSTPVPVMGRLLLKCH